MSCQELDIQETPFTQPFIIQQFVLLTFQNPFSFFQNAISAISTFDFQFLCQKVIFKLHSRHQLARLLMLMWKVLPHIQVLYLANLTMRTIITMAQPKTPTIISSKFCQVLKVCHQSHESSNRNTKIQ